VSVHKAQVEALRDKVHQFATTNGEKLCLQCEGQASLLLRWLPYLQKSLQTGNADVLLQGFGSAIVEAAACATLGLVRPAIFSLRTQIDMLLSWLFFKDHSVEWKYVENTGEGFRLKSDVIKYLETYYEGYGERFAIFKQTKKRKEDDPYRLLSAHVHSQSSKAVPFVANLADIVSDVMKCQEIALLQSECSEYLNDVLLACFAPKWANLPKEIVSQATSRLSPAQRKVIFS
jgi:hypothetical protein